MYEYWHQNGERLKRFDLLSEAVAHGEKHKGRVVVTTMRDGAPMKLLEISLTGSEFEAWLDVVLGTPLVQDY